MSLPIPHLDDLTFQEIVDHAKRLIPRYCPEWTDHNVSDPGVTLIELFASMCDMLLYRVNQTPEKMYRTFLNLLGVQLDPPYPACVAVTFYLSAPMRPDADDLPIPCGAQVSTVRTEVTAPLIFTTRDELRLTPARMSDTLRTRLTLPDQPGEWSLHHHTSGAFSASVRLFDLEPAPDNAFYLQFDRDISSLVIDLSLACVPNEGSGITEGIDPPQVWEVASGSALTWKPCEVEHDTTYGFNKDGVVRLRIPSASPHELDGVTAWWIRCWLDDRQTGKEGSYTASPQLKGITASTVGGAVLADHAVTVTNEFLGESDGTVGQSFRLRNAPVLLRKPEQDVLIVETHEGREVWKEVSDFGDSEKDDPHYTLDSRTGVITLGPTIPLPEGGVYRFGRTPPAGSRLTMQSYQYGGGSAGNVPAHAISQLQTAIPYISRVTNWKQARGGRDAQSIEEALLRAPQRLRTRDRAVTADDYVYLALNASPQVGRAHCLAPGVWPRPANGTRPGEVTVLILPRVDKPDQRLEPEQLIPGNHLLAAVQSRLEGRMVLGASLRVVAPRIVPIHVKATILGQTGGNGAAALRERVEARLNAYLNPYTGGPDGAGWPFGRAVYANEIAGLLQNIPGVERVEDVRLSHDASTSEPALQVQLEPDQVVASARHEITVI